MSDKRTVIIRRRIITSLALAIVVIGGGTYIYSRTSKSTNTANDTVKVNAQEPAKNAESTATKPKADQIVPNGNIIYSAQSYAVPANEVQQMLEGKSKDTQKQVFLTFDDGPSPNTEKILKILKDEGVHATFFVLGSSIKSEEGKKLLKEEIESGNAIANHSYSHDYRKLYPHNSVDVPVFMNEINTTNDEMRKILGDDFNARVVRMPGGYMSRRYYKDPSLPALNTAFNKEHITSIDWDAETGDATGKKYTAAQILQNVEKQTKNETHVVLLMHDAAAKKQTVETLPEVIQYFKNNGYEFKVISNPTVDSFNNK